jgi:hypothetical protein
MATRIRSKKDKNGRISGIMEEAVYDKETKKSKWKFIKNLGPQIGVGSDGESIYTTMEKLKKFYLEYHDFIDCLKNGRFKVVNYGEIQFLKERVDHEISALRKKAELTEAEYFYLFAGIIYLLTSPEIFAFSDLQDWIDNSSLLYDAETQKLRDLNDLEEKLIAASRKIQKNNYFFEDKVHLISYQTPFSIDSNSNHESNDILVMFGPKSVQLSVIFKGMQIPKIIPPKPYKELNDNEKTERLECIKNAEFLSPFIEKIAKQIRLSECNEDLISSWIVLSTIACNTYLSQYLVLQNCGYDKDQLRRRWETELLKRGKIRAILTLDQPCYLLTQKNS